MGFSGPYILPVIQQEMRKSTEGNQAPTPVSAPASSFLLPPAKSRGRGTGHFMPTLRCQYPAVIHCLLLDHHNTTKGNGMVRQASVSHYSPSTMDYFNKGIKNHSMIGPSIITSPHNDPEFMIIVYLSDN